MKPVYLSLIILLLAACSHHEKVKAPLGNIDTLSIPAGQPPRSVAAKVDTIQNARPIEGRQFCWVAGELVNLRSEPNINAPVIKKLAQGSKLQLLEDVEMQYIDGSTITDRWYKVNIPGKTDQVGYVSSSLVMLNKPGDPLEDFLASLHRPIIPGESMPALISGASYGSDKGTLIVNVTSDWDAILKAYTIYPISHPDRPFVQKESVTRLENIASKLFLVWNDCLKKNGFGPAQAVSFVNGSGDTVGQVYRGKKPAIYVQY